MEAVEAIPTIVESIILAVAVYVAVVSMWAMTKEPWCDRKGTCEPEAEAGDGDGR